METSGKDITLRLEKVNSYIHAIGILFGIISMPFLIKNADEDGQSLTVAGAIIYALCFLMVFISSTLYHGLPPSRKKENWKIIDHISIYFLIAGTYTPFILIFVNNVFGNTLLVILWSLTLLGMIFKIFFTGSLEILSTLVYLFMGWILFADSKTFFKNMPPMIIELVTLGGILYTIGIIFYLWQKYTYHHVIWHVFVLAAAICHYAAVLLAV
ncbi:MAG: hemolysin III family protein [Ferruginibacter sp.]